MKKGQLLRMPNFYPDNEVMNALVPALDKAGLMLVRVPRLQATATSIRGWENALTRKPSFQEIK